jgi:hypothetical protein
MTLSDAARAQSRKILVAVIDSNGEHRRQVASALTSFYQVADFAHFDMAVEGLAQSPPCVILLDEQASPSLGGCPTAASIKNPCRRKTPCP